MTKETYLHDKHVQLGAKMVDFAGWHMPVQYTSIIEEHKTVRENVGLFDVSHMGQVFVSGNDALKFLQKIVRENLTCAAKFDTISTWTIRKKFSVRSTRTGC